MTAPDVRTAAQTEADRVRFRLKGHDYPANRHYKLGFEDGAVWGAALVTPTRRQAILAAQDALGCDIDGLEGFMPGCQEHEVDITEEGLCPSASTAAEAVLALMNGNAGETG